LTDGHLVDKLSLDGKMVSPETTDGQWSSYEQRFKPMCPMDNYQHNGYLVDKCLNKGQTVS
jgi:hypothetical protein